MQHAGGMLLAPAGRRETLIFLSWGKKNATKSGRYPLPRYIPCAIFITEVIAMLDMIKGCKIHDPSILFEGYEQTDNGFAANVDADNIQPLLESFVRLHNDYCFLILEVPTNTNEDEFFLSGAEKPSKDVYYWDGMRPDIAVKFLREYGHWLIHDGMSGFGIGIHSGGNEIMVGKYNVVTVYTRTPEAYDGFFEGLGIPYTADLKTAWDYFTAETPGDSFLYKYKDKNIYDLVEALKPYGLYFAERRESES